MIPLPSPGVVDIWWIYLDGLVYSPDMWLTLDEEERSRASRIVQAVNRFHFVTSHFALRSILSSYLELSPSKVPLIRSQFGKPLVNGSGLHFSFSKSSGLAIVSVAQCAVGVDLEKLGDGRDLESDSKLFLSPEESRQLATLPKIELHRELYRSWCRKEAYLKATGQGLQVPPNSFAIASQANGFQVLGPGAEDSSQTIGLRDITLPSGWTACVVALCVLDKIVDRLWDKTGPKLQYLP